jgi:hypothetical protein
VSITEFFEYLVNREPTRELGLQLAAVYTDRSSRRRPVVVER